MNKFSNLTLFTIICVTACISASITFYILNAVFPQRSPTISDIFDSPAINSNIRDKLINNSTKLDKLIDDIEEDERKFGEGKSSKEIDANKIIEKRQLVSKMYSEISDTLAGSTPSIVAHDYGIYPITKEFITSLDRAMAEAPKLNKPLLRYKLK